jgi:hypothetical protein
MGMKREYKGQEGFFYKSGNKKLTQDVGIINSARRMKEGLESSYLALLITKENGRSTVFAVDSPYDVLDVMCELGVNKPSEVARLPEEKRRVVMYCEPNIGMNYGFCFADKYNMPISPRRKLGEIKDGKVYVGPPSARCLEVAKEMKRMMRDKTGYNILIK